MMPPDAPKDVILSIRGLELDFPTRIGGGASVVASVLHGVDFEVRAGEVHAIVGESGSGKSSSFLAPLGLYPGPKPMLRGSFAFEGKELVGLPERELRLVRGTGIAMIFQDPVRYFDPSIKIGRQIAETIAVADRRGRKSGAASSRSRADRQSRARELLLSVGLADADRVLAAYPREVSVGMCQRAMIAQALAGAPRLLIADEATSSVDASRRRGIERLIRGLASERGLAVVFISHDLRSVRRIADRVSTMRAGRIVETELV
jgi:ABC-type dipeptide/oligopeptide/nickel transport system ATPase component